MEQYELFYKQTLIGVLTVDPISRKHRYEPDASGISAVKAQADLSGLERASDGFVDPIPFFQNRLMHMNRWGLREINYQTDWFLLRRIDG